MSAQPQPPILVIEDDPDVRETIVETLESEGYAAVGVPEGAAALQWLRDSGVTPAVILLDLMMPGMTGEEFRDEQLADPALAGIPVVVLSADSTIREMAAALHVAAFLPKPVKLDALLATARRFAGSAREPPSGGH